MHIVQPIDRFQDSLPVGSTDDTVIPDLEDIVPDVGDVQGDPHVEEAMGGKDPKSWLSAFGAVDDVCSSPLACAIVRWHEDLSPQ